MLSNWLGSWARSIARVVAKTVAKTGVTPNTVTFIGFLVNVVAAYALYRGLFVLGGLLILAAGIFDMLDGALAKITNSVSKFGGFLDSTIDRYSEAIIYLGLLLYFQLARGAMLESVLIYVVVVGSVMISYTRARAGALKIDCEVGLLARTERIILLAGGLLINQVLIVLILLALLTHLTAFQRIFHVWTVSRAESKQEKKEEKDETRASSLRLRS